MMEAKTDPDSAIEEQKKGCCTPSNPDGILPSAPAQPGSATLPIAAREDLATTRERMIALNGGTFLMGTDSADANPLDGEGPVREVTLAPFLLDRYPVTNALFAQFIAATGYRTEAELFGWSFVFWSHIPKHRYAELVEDTVQAAPWWCKVPGARWDAPRGPGSTIAGIEDHPAVHISFHDAEAFCQWSGQRLPTEAEWEYAARGGLAQKLYPWGDQLRPGGEHRCNIFQGEFPQNDTADDGYAGTSPVEAFPPNGFGIYSITGNAWEWCSDWFSTDFHHTASMTNPSGPPAGTGRVMKGGSFLCHRSYCNRYRVAARTSNTPDSSAENISFRCALSL